MKRRMIIFGVALLVLAAGVAVYVASRPTRPAPAFGQRSAASPSAPATAMPRLDHVFVILMENKSADEIYGAPSAPYINRLIDRYAYAADYSAITHPSLPNYIALTSGSTQGITDDRSPPGAGYAVDVPNLADSLEAAGSGWKAYAEAIPAPGYAENSGRFVTKHVPFLYYTDILRDTSRRTSHIVRFTDLQNDLRRSSTTPAFAFITPDMCSDMHDCPVSEGDAWLSRTVPMILESEAFRAGPSLLAVTWDEGEGSDNHVATILAGPSVRSCVSLEPALRPLLAAPHDRGGARPSAAHDQRPLRSRHARVLPALIKVGRESRSSYATARSAAPSSSLRCLQLCASSCCFRHAHSRRRVGVATSTPARATPPQTAKIHPPNAP